MIFKNRVDAGKRLAIALRKYLGQDAIVYALPRGGVAVGHQIAKYLNAPLDLIITRKIGHPFNSEYAICVVAEDGHRICNESEVKAVDKVWFEERIKSEMAEAKRRRKLYLNGKYSLDPKGKTAILVDDGAATGLSFLLAIEELRHRKPHRIVAALPVASKDIADKIQIEADDMAILNIPFQFMGAVGAYYEEFDQVGDEEVISLLHHLPSGREKNYRK